MEAQENTSWNDAFGFLSNYIYIVYIHMEYEVVVLLCREWC